MSKYDKNQSTEINCNTISISNSSLNLTQKGFAEPRLDEKESNKLTKDYKGNSSGSAEAIDPTMLYSNTFDKKDNYYWDDFVAKWTRHIFDSEEELVKTLTPEINKVCVFITKGNKQIMKLNKDNLFNYFNTNRFKVSYISKSGEKHMRWKEIVRLCHKGLRIYNHTFIDPNPKTSTSTENMNNFNLWAGFKANLLDNVDMEKVQPILDYIKTVLANREDEIYNHIIDMACQYNTNTMGFNTCCSYICM